MFKLFRQGTKDVKEIRNLILQFIKEKLQTAEGGEGSNILAVYLYINCQETERHLYEAAVYANTPDKFKSEEVQRIADDFAIKLPANWKFEISFTDKYPSQSYIAKDVEVALYISTNRGGANPKKGRAYIRILNGHAEKESYSIESTAGKINIGREIQVQTASGFIRKNAIAFTSPGSTEMNRSVSRQHAHIEWEPQSGSFLIFADEGGIPPFNKMKIKSIAGVFTKLQAIEVGHRLEEGDQILLGDNAVLEFTYSGE